MEKKEREREREDLNCNYLTKKRKKNTWIWILNWFLFVFCVRMDDDIDDIINWVLSFIFRILILNFGLC